MSCENCNCPKKKMSKNMTCSANIELTQKEKKFVETLAQYIYLPVTRFMLENQEKESKVMLSPIFIENKSQTFEETEVLAKILYSLETQGVISLDYHEKLQGANYSEYKNSEIYKEFCNSVEIVGQPKKTPFIQCGSMALTCRGQKVAELELNG